MISEDWAYAVQINQALTWRERLGNWLRGLASRVDGRTSMAIRMTTTPPLDQAARLEVLHTGVSQIIQSAKEASLWAAQERLLQRACPDLFESHSNHG